MGPAGRLRRDRVVVRGRLVQAAADDEHRIGGGEPLAHRRGRTETGHPEVERVLVRDDVGSSPGGDDRDLQQFRELQQLGRRAGAQDAAAGEDDRALGRGEQLDDRTQVLVGGSCRARSPGVHARIVGRRLIEQVLRERQQDRPGPPAERLADGLGHDRGDVRRLAGLGGPFRQPADGRDRLDLLERLVPAMRVLDLADDREHRGRVLAGRVDADGEIRGPDAARAEADGGSTRELAVGLGHERGAALVAGGDDADAGITERVEEAQERFAGHGERVADAGAAQGVGDEAADGPWALGGGCARRPAPLQRAPLRPALRWPRWPGAGLAPRGPPSAAVAVRQAARRRLPRLARRFGRGPFRRARWLGRRQVHRRPLAGCLLRRRRRLRTRRWAARAPRAAWRRARRSSDRPSPPRSPRSPRSRIRSSGVPRCERTQTATG